MFFIASGCAFGGVKSEEPTAILRTARKLTDNYGGSRKRPLRWGIAPVSRIAHDFAQALSVLPHSNHRLVACVASYRSQADEFAKQFRLPKTYTNFVEMARSKDIDAVYVSPLNPMHLELGRLMLDYGKHVLCETPFCMNEHEAVQLIGHSHYKGCFLMEGQWSRFLPAYRFIRTAVESGELGNIVELQCTFGSPGLMGLERVSSRKLGGGVTMEMGPTVIQLALWLFRMQPFNIRTTGILNEDGVDRSATIELDFCCCRKAVLTITADHMTNNTARIIGEKGTLVVPNFWCPTEVVDSKGVTQHFDIPEDDNLHRTNYPKRLAMCYEAEEVRNCIINGKQQSALVTHNETLVIQRICDEVRRQLGVIFDADKAVKRDLAPSSEKRLREHVTI